MLATGGIMTAMAELQKRGVDPALTRIISVVAAPQLYKIECSLSWLIIYTATIDEAVNSQGFIVPGLGMQAIAFGTFSPLKGLISTLIQVIHILTLVVGDLSQSNTKLEQLGQLAVNLKKLQHFQEGGNNMNQRWFYKRISSWTIVGGLVGGVWGRFLLLNVLTNRQRKQSHYGMPACQMVTIARGSDAQSI